MVFLEEIVKKIQLDSSLGRAIGLGIVLSVNIASTSAGITCTILMIVWLASTPLAPGAVIPCAGSTVITGVSSVVYQSIHDNGNQIVGERSGVDQNIYSNTSLVCCG